MLVPNDLVVFRLEPGRRDPWDLIGRHADGRLVLFTDLIPSRVLEHTRRRVMEKGDVWIVAREVVFRPKCLLARVRYPLSAALTDSVGPEYLFAYGTDELSAREELTREVAVCAEAGASLA